MSTLGHQLRWEQRLFWRNREAAVFVFVFPPMLYLLLGALYDGEINGFRASDVLLAGLISYGCANTMFGGLAITLVFRREMGILKRIRGTPLPAWAYLAAATTSNMLVFALQMVVTIGLGLAFYDASGPVSWLHLVVAGVLGAVAFAGLGFGTAALIRSSEGSSAVVNLILLPMAFLSGAFGPTDDYPEVLQAIGDVLPLKYLVDLLEDAYLRGDAVWENPAAIAALALWGAAGYAVAARRFGWEPRER